MTRSPLPYLGGILALWLLAPILAFAVRFAASPSRGFEAPGLAAAFGTSILSASISTAVIVVLGVPLAYVLARSRSGLARAVNVLVQLPLALPPVMSGVVLIYIVGPYTVLGELFDDHLTGSVVGIVLAQTFVASPFLVIAARSAFAALDPSLDDLAATLGHRPIARFLRVAVPAASTGIAAGILLTWLRALGEYGATVLLAYHPYSLPVFTSVQFQSGGIPGTQAPTALALGIAIAAVLLGLARRPRRRNRANALPAPVEPRAQAPTAVSFDLDAAVGSFRLRTRHRATASRIAILGPSGAGKSVTLRALAGLLGDSAGVVHFADDDVTGLPTATRGVGYVPQGGTLLPGRTVREQLLFGVDADQGVAAWWIETLGLGGLEGRLPEQLSGGQRQRVALASALTRQPRVVLLDEPFSGLDTPVREELRREVRRLQRERGLSTVLVTHDPEEAAMLADEILVVEGGRLLQAGTRADVYARPGSPEVARLLGIPNVLRARALSAGLLGTGDVTLEWPAADLAPGDRVFWSIRPERIHLVEPRATTALQDPPRPHPAHPAQVLDVAELGAATAVILRLVGGPELRVRTTETVTAEPGDRIDVWWDPSDVNLWPADDGEASIPTPHPAAS